VIVHISSINALRPEVGAVVYAATKAGSTSITQSMARELAPDSIRVVAIAPGDIALDNAPAADAAMAAEGAGGDVANQTPLGAAHGGYRRDGGVCLFAGRALCDRGHLGGRRRVARMTLRSDRSERAERVALSHRALQTQHHDSSGTFCRHGGASGSIKRPDRADRSAPGNPRADASRGHEQPVVGRGMMDLQMGFVDIPGRAKKLPMQLGRTWRGRATDVHEQVLKPAVQGSQVAGRRRRGRDIRHRSPGSSGAWAALSVRPGKNGPAQHQNRSNAAAIRRWVRSMDFSCDDVACPRQQLIGPAGAVQYRRSAWLGRGLRYRKGARAASSRSRA